MVLEELRWEFCCSFYYLDNLQSNLLWSLVIFCYCVLFLSVGVFLVSQVSDGEFRNVVIW